MLNNIISKPKSIDLLITGGCIVTLNNKNSIINNGSIAIKNTKIVEVGNSNLIDKKYDYSCCGNFRGFLTNSIRKAPKKVKIANTENGIT